MIKYEVINYCSDNNKKIIAKIPELKGCIALRETQNEDLKEVN